MARQKYSSRQAETKASIENVPINSSNNSSNQTDQAIKQIKQSNRSSKQTDQANKQIKQSNRSSKQTDQTNKQIKQASRSSKQTKSPREAFTLLLRSKPSRQVEIKRTSGNQASVEYRARKSNKEYEAIEQNRQNRQAAAIPALCTTICSAWLSRLKEMPLQLLPK